MKTQELVALVTGANRGLGLAFTRELVAAGARKVYAASRQPASIGLPGVYSIQLDVTVPGQIAIAARDYGDVNLLINNAGISFGASFLSPNSIEAARAELETNFFGPLAMSRAFAGVLARNGGGAIVNVLSVLSWLNLPQAATYGASKAASWSLTNGLRGELRGQGTQVLGLHLAYLDTDMARHVKGPKAHPHEVARQVLAALDAGHDEVLADGLTRQVKQDLSATPGIYIDFGRPELRTAPYGAIGVAPGGKYGTESKSEDTRR
jgi:NAD(P)-dependent dehydrogenase (short-subunit alcohol dehydrogenase family)